MKNLWTILLAMAALLAVSCKKEDAKAAEVKEEQKVEVSNTGKQFAITPATSMVTWKGSKKLGSSHEGTIGIKSGSLKLKDGNISGGKFVIDMTSIKNTDIKDADQNGKLVGHLSSADFFDVEKFPTATYEVTDCRKIENSESGNTHQITGNLTIKGVTQSLTIPAKVAVANGGLTATSQKFKINRTDWGIKYGSGLIGTVEDNIINDDIVLSIKLTGKS